jgi:hypothetical protein
VRGADDAHIDRDLLTPADALDGALLQEAQQLGLQRKRQVADFVEHQGAAAGGLDLAERLLGGTGEGAFLVAEQLAFEQVLGNGGAIDGHELARLARRCLVQAARQHSLPVPLSPSSMTVALLLATFSMVRHTAQHAGSRVVSPASASGGCISLQARFSACNSARRKARSTVRLSSSGSNGLAKKS